MQTHRDEAGQAVPIMAVVVALAVVATLGVARVGVAATAAARAQSVADLVALAAAGGGDGQVVARANGAEVVGLQRRVSTVVAEIRLNGVRAIAAAVGPVPAAAVGPPPAARALVRAASPGPRSVSYARLSMLQLV